MSASSARQSANTSNAQLSTGPRTPEGKTRSAQNARKHGLTAREVVIGPEDRAEFDALLADFEADVAPQGAIQQALFSELVAAAWNLRRIRRMETEACSSAATWQDLLDDELQIKLDRLGRHKSRIERTFHRTLKELKTLQTNQAIGALIPSDIRPIAPPLASTIEIAKRTQAARSSQLFQPPLDPVELEWVAPPGSDPAEIDAAEPEENARHLVASSTQVA